MSVRLCREQVTNVPYATVVQRYEPSVDKRLRHLFLDRPLNLHLTSALSRLLRPNVKQWNFKPKMISNELLPVTIDYSTEELYRRGNSHLLII